MALEDKCFIDWRGDIDFHRSYDVMISPQDVEWIREEIAQRAQRFCKAIPLPKEGSVIPFGERGTDMDKEYADVKFTVSTGKGPKFVVNPDYNGYPVRISDIREEVPIKYRVDAIADHIFKTFCWADRDVKLAEVQKGDLLFSFPKILMPLIDFESLNNRHDFIKGLQREIYRTFSSWEKDPLPFEDVEIRFTNEYDLPMVEFYAV